MLGTALVGKVMVLQGGWGLRSPAGRRGEGGVCSGAGASAVGKGFGDGGGRHVDRGWQLRMAL